jgi:very-short-patch-repair endonuclease
MRRSPTLAERRVWRFLRGRHFLGYKFRRQYPVAGFILDFYCPELKLAIELDGSQHAAAPGHEYDDRRAMKLRSLEIEIVRIANELPVRDPPLFEETLRVAIENARLRK